MLSAFFSGAEIAFVSANKLRVELKRYSGTRRGLILARFFEQPAHFIGTMLVGNNISLVVFTVLMSSILNPHIEPFIQKGWLIQFIITIIVTVFVLIFGEFLPKTFFRLFADDILYFFAFPLRFFDYILSFPTWLMNKLSSWVLKYALKTPAEQGDIAFTRLDLEHFLDNSVAEDEDEIDTELFKNALHLQHVKVKECMIPRMEIQSVEVNETIDDLKQVFTETKLSRILVIEDDIDNILGYVHHQQMWNKPDNIRQILMDIPFVPEAMKVQLLLNKFIKEQISMACVVDEYGGTAGIITLEDILEEIFGEIEDEHDKEEYVESQISETEYLFSGRLEIDYLNEKYEALGFPEGEYHTLSGYLVMTTESIPLQGEAIELGDYRFVLEMVSDTKIETIRVFKIKQPEEKLDD